jgi:hypothetical protein
MTPAARHVMSFPDMHVENATPLSIFFTFLYNLPICFI